MDKRIKILNAAEILIKERGFYGLSIKVIAQQAGVAAGTIYCYFENKDALLNQLYRHILSESAKTIFTGWQEQDTAKQKYDRLWQNTYQAVLKNPNRLAVIDMLRCTLDNSQQETAVLDDNTFGKLRGFYLQGIDDGLLRNWPVAALVALSFDSAINLAKKVLTNKVMPDQILLDEVRDASWLIIQKQ
ncbi:MAG: TetR/AcrR family transcriptional regulator [Psychromonas sp.]